MRQRPSSKHRSASSTTESRGLNSAAGAALAALAASCLLTGSARSDVLGDCARLALSWQSESEAEVFSFDPQLLVRGQKRPLLLPPAAVNPTTANCVTVAIVGSPTTSFEVDLLTVPEGRYARSEGYPRRALGGLLTLKECGSAKAQLSALAIELRSPRAVVQVVAAVAERPLALPTTLLPHRAPGPLAPLVDAGPIPDPGPLDARVARLERWAREQQARPERNAELTVDADGLGTSWLQLSPGCHRIDALGPRAPVRDLDLIAKSGSGELLAEDRSARPDALVELCVATPTTTELRIYGGQSRQTLQVYHHSLPLPEGLPAHWAPNAKAELARLARRYHLQGFSGVRIAETLGVYGRTTLPFDTEPGSCYLAAAVPFHGSNHGLELVLSSGARRSENRSFEGGVVSSLCLDETLEAKLELTARIPGQAWVAAIWQRARPRVEEAAR